MKLYLITKTQVTCYDTYNNMVVAAESEDNAKLILPPHCPSFENNYAWCDSVEHVKARYLGEADKGIEEGVIVASFNAG